MTESEYKTLIDLLIERWDLERDVNSFCLRAADIVSAWLVQTARDQVSSAMNWHPNSVDRFYGSDGC